MNTPQERREAAEAIAAMRNKPEREGNSIKILIDHKLDELRGDDYQLKGVNLVGHRSHGEHGPMGRGKK